MTNQQLPAQPFSPSQTIAVRPAVYWITGLAIFAMYLVTMPLQVTMEDSGMFLLSARYGSMSHPPGYPLYNLLGYLFTHLPLATVAVRLHVMSAVAGAAACLMLLWLSCRMGATWIPAVIATCALACSKIFWSQSIIAEVYTLNALLFMIVTCCCWQFRTGAQRRYLWMAAFVFGLSLSNHWPLMITSAPCFFFLVLPRWRLVLRNLHWLVLCFLPGLLPYLFMVLRSWQDPAISYYGPLQHWNDFLFVLLRQGYFNPDADRMVTSLHRYQQAAFVAGQVLYAMTLPGTIAIVAGLWAARRNGWTCSIAFLWVWLAVPVIIWWHCIVPPEPLVQSSMSAFLLPTLLAGAISLALGLQRIMTALQHSARGILVTCLCIIAIPGWLLYRNFEINNRHEDFWAYEYGLAMLSALPHDAILFVSNDIDTGVVGYLHFIEGYREDIQLLHRNGNMFNPRVVSPFQSTTIRNEELVNYCRQQSRTIFSTQALPMAMGYNAYVLFQQPAVDIPIDAIGFEPKDIFMDLFDRFEAADTIHDTWTRSIRQHVIGSTAAVLAPWLYGRPDEPTDSLYRKRLVKAESHFLGRIRSVAALMRWETPEVLLEKLQGAEDLITADTPPKFEANLYAIRGQLYEFQENHKLALQNYLQALKIYYMPDSDTIPILIRFYEKRGQYAQVEKLKSLYRID